MAISNVTAASELPSGATGSVAGANIARSEAASTHPHGWFAVIWLIYLIDYADRFAISVVLTPIQQEFGLNDSQLGLLSGALFFGLAVLAIPSGIAIDRFSRKYMISLMTTVWSLATYVTGIVTSYSGLLLARVFVGAGEAGYNPAGYALIAAWYPKRLHGTMVGLFNTAQPLGIAVGMVAAGFIAEHYGWRAVFGVLAIPGLVLAAVMLFAPDYKVQKADPGVEPGRAQAVRPGVGETLRFIYRNRTLKLIYLAQLPITFWIMSINIWFPTLLVRHFGMSLSDAGLLMLGPCVVAALGAIFGGWLSDRVARNNPRARVTICVVFIAIGLLLMGPGMVALTADAIPIYAFMALGGLAMFFAVGNWGTLVTAGLDQSPAHYRATIQCFLPMFQAVAIMVTSIVTGFLSQQYGLPVTLTITTLLGTAAAIVILLLARSSYDRDFKHQDAYRVAVVTD
jgi:MFS family permease